MDSINTIEGSAPIFNKQLNIFKLPPSDVSVTSSHYGTIFPQFSIKENDVPLEFTMNGDSLHWVDLSKSLVYLRLRIINKDGTSIDPGTSISMTNLGFHSMWESVDLYINSVLVTKSSSLYPYKAYINKLLSLGEDVKTTSLTQELFYKDAFNLTTYDTNKKGYKERFDQTKGSKYFELIGVPDEPLFYQERLLPPNTEVKLRFRHSRPDFCLEGRAPDCKIELDEAVFLPFRVVLHPEIHSSLTSRLKAGEVAKFPIVSRELKSFTIPSGSTSQTCEAVFSGKLPQQIIIGMVEYNGTTKVYIGAVGESAFNFKDFGLQSAGISIDNENAMSRSYNFDVDNGRYLAGYNSLFQILGDKGDSNFLSREDYVNGNFLLAFKLDANTAAQAFSIQKTGNIQINLKFKTALTESIQLIVCGEFQGLLQIDGEKNIAIE